MKTLVEMQAEPQREYGRIVAVTVEPPYVNGCGFWFWGNPTPEELRQGLREITRAEQPSFDPQRTRR